MSRHADDSDLEEVYNTERQLLYVACTRARDHLLVTSVSPPSEFLGECTKDRLKQTVPQIDNSLCDDCGEDRCNGMTDFCMQIGR